MESTTTISQMILAAGIEFGGWVVCFFSLRMGLKRFAQVIDGEITSTVSMIFALLLPQVLVVQWVYGHVPLRWWWIMLLAGSIASLFTVIFDRIVSPAPADTTTNSSDTRSNDRPANGETTMRNLFLSHAGMIATLLFLSVPQYLVLRDMVSRAHLWLWMPFVAVGGIALMITGILWIMHTMWKDNMFALYLLPVMLALMVVIIAGVYGAGLAWVLGFPRVT